MHTHSERLTEWQEIDVDIVSYDETQRNDGTTQICKICLMCRKFIAFLVNWASKCQHTLH